MTNDRNEIIPADDGLLSQYEKLYLRMQNLRQECVQLRGRYMQLFGQLTIQRFSLRIKIIRLKKEIALYVLTYNKGETPDPQVIAQSLNKEMAAWYAMFKDLVHQEKLIREAEPISEEEELKIRKIFRSLVHLIHPDLHPELESDEEMKTLWNELVTAYHIADLETMEEIQVQILYRLRLLGETTTVPSHDAVEERIERLKEKIEKIQSKDPYLYRDWIDDPEKVQEKKNEMQEFNESLKAYLDSLNQQLQELISSRENLYA